MRNARRRLLLLLAASLFLAETSQRPAAAQLLGPEFQINSYTTDAQFYPAVAADDAGNFIVVWTSQGQDGSYLGVFGQRFDAAGLPVGSEFQVNSYTTGFQEWPEAAPDGSGGTIVVWQDSGKDGSLHGVFGRRFDPAGLPLGGEFQVNSYTTDYQDGPAVAADSMGNFVVVWNSRYQDGSDTGVFGQRFDSLGLPAGVEFQVNSQTTGYQCMPAVAAVRSGGFVVVWLDRSQDGSGDDVFGRRFDSEGLPLGGEFQVDTYTTWPLWAPAVAVDGSGNFVVAWNSYGQDGSWGGIFARRFDSAGAPMGGEFRVNSYTTEHQLWPEVAADSAGNFVVVWSSGRVQDGSSWGVFGQRFDSAGLPVGNEFRINSYTTNEQMSAAVAADGSGNFVVAWDSYYGQDGSYTGVFGRQVRVTIFSDGFEAGDACAWTLAVGGGCP